MAIILSGILLLFVLALTIAFNSSASKLEKRLSRLVEDQLDRVQYVERALSHLQREERPTKV